MVNEVLVYIPLMITYVKGDDDDDDDNAVIIVVVVVINTIQDGYLCIYTLLHTLSQHKMSIDATSWRAGKWVTIAL